MECGAVTATFVFEEYIEYDVVSGEVVNGDVW